MDTLVHCDGLDVLVCHGRTVHHRFSSLATFVESFHLEEFSGPCTLDKGPRAVPRIDRAVRFAHDKGIRFGHDRRPSPCMQMARMSVAQGACMTVNPCRLVATGHQQGDTRLVGLVPMPEWMRSFL